MDLSILGRNIDDGVPELDTNIFNSHSPISILFKENQLLSRCLVSL